MIKQILVILVLAQIAVALKPAFRKGAFLSTSEKLQYDHFTPDHCVEGKALTKQDATEYTEMLAAFSKNIGEKTGKFNGKMPASKCPVKDTTFCQNKPLFIITWGPSSSGKSYLLDKFFPRLFDNHKQCFLSALVDDMIEASPSFTTANYFKLRNLGSCLNDRLMEKAMEKKAHIVFETIGKSALQEPWMTEFVTKISKTYCPIILYPFVEAENIKKRLEERNKKSERKMKFEDVESQMPGTMNNFLAFCEKIQAFRCTLFDNNGSDPTVVFSYYYNLKNKSSKYDCKNNKFICDHSKKALKIDSTTAKPLAAEVEMFRGFATKCGITC